MRVSEDGDRRAGITGALPVRLSVESVEPLYRQLEEQLRDLVVSGRLRPGDQLPSVRALARELECSVITTRRAYQDLAHEGLIHTRQGLGAVVADIGTEERDMHRRKIVATALTDAVETGRQMGCSRAELESIFASVMDGEIPQEPQEGGAGAAGRGPAGTADTERRG